LNVQAKDVGTGKAESIVIKNEKGRLSQEEIDRMVNEATKFEAEDKKMKEKIDARNDFEGVAYNARNTVNDEKKVGDKLTADEKQKVLDAAKVATDWLEKNPSAEKEEYDAKKKELTDIIHPILAKMYPQGQGGPGGAPGQEPPKGEMPKHDEL